MSETRTNVIYLAVGLIVGVLFTMIFSGLYYGEQLVELQNTKEVIVVEYHPLGDLDFQIVPHEKPMWGVDEENQYWTEEYYILVFRVGETYYLKLYTVSEFEVLGDD